MHLLAHNDAPDVLQDYYSDRIQPISKVKVIILLFFSYLNYKRFPKLSVSRFSLSRKEKIWLHLQKKLSKYN